MTIKNEGSPRGGSLFSIGDVARICGVSIQTLRFYDKTNLIKPYYINPETGYRYYIPSQFQIIDRIRYLQKFSFSLEEIRDILNNCNENLNYFTQKLGEKINDVEAIRDNAEKTLKEIKWYYNLFHIGSDSSYQNLVFRQHFDERYILYEKSVNNETENECYQRMLQKKSENQYDKLLWRFQFCYSVEINDICNKVFRPTGVGVFLGEKPDTGLENVITLPEGDYICYQSCLRTKNWTPEPLKNFIANKTHPDFVIAVEVENHLYDFENSFFTIEFPVNG